MPAIASCKNVGTYTSSRSVLLAESHCVIMLMARQVMVCATTGSGKTLSFVLPGVARAVHHGELGQGMPIIDAPVCLFLEPTRELAAQVEKQTKVQLQGMPSSAQRLILTGCPRTHPGPRSRDSKHKNRAAGERHTHPTTSRTGYTQAATILWCCDTRLLCSVIACSRVYSSLWPRLAACTTC